MTPILDLMVKHGDLIVATSGRAFWILDDLGLLRQYEGPGNTFKLYQPEDALLANGGSELDRTDADFDGTHPLRGVNPAHGVVIYYHLPEGMNSEEVELTITDQDGHLVRRISSEADETFQSYAGGPPAEPTLSTKPGLNRFVWDMRYPTMTGAPTAYIEGSFRGHKASPGEYTLTLKAGEEELTTTATILKNPLYDLSDEDYEDYHQFMTAAGQKLNEMHRMVNDMMSLQKQLSGIIADMDTEKQQNLKNNARALLEKMKAWDEEMIQRKSKAYDDVENFPNKFTANYLFAINHAESSIPRVNQPTRERIAELNTRWNELKQEGEAILKTDVPALNKKLWNAGIGALWTGEGSGGAEK